MATIRRTHAFTIVELLIVIVVIAILAAISIVAYNGIQERARSSASASSSTQVAKKVKVWQVDNEATSPTCGQFYTIVTNTSSSTACSFDYNGTNYQYAAGTNGAYCVTTTVVDKSYKVSDNTTPQAGGCPGHGQGGVGAVTNLAVNPSFETNTSAWSNISAAISRSTNGSVSGTYSAVITPAGGTPDTFIRVGGTNTFPDNVSPGNTYTVSATIHIPTPQSGSLDSRARGITVYSWNGGTPSTQAQSSVAANASGSYRISTTFSVPSNSTALEIRLYNGATNSASNLIYWDAVMITAGSTQFTYRDGSSVDWTWNGPTNNSTSTGPAP